MAAAVLILAMAAAAMFLAVSGGAGGGGFLPSVLSLERAFPLGQKVELEELKARDKARHARILQSFNGGIVDFAVMGTSDPYRVGLYFTRVKLGSPPREFNVQIDTGSDILWLSCDSCADCPRTSGLGIELNFFSVAGSSTSSMISCSDAECSSIVRTAAAQCSGQSNQCGYSFQYGDGSGTDGYYVSDLLYFDAFLGTSLVANSTAPIVFGCSTTQTGDLTKSDRAIDGIFGFGQQELSVISQLSSRGITPKVFSHCLKGEGNGGGILVLGAIQDPGLVYTPLVPSQPHYNLYLQSIAVNGQLLPIDSAVFATSDNRGTIIDSGTTLAYLVAEAYDPLVSSITAAVSQSARSVMSRGNRCYMAYRGISEIFPPVTLNFAGDASMTLRPEDYLVYPPDRDFQGGAQMWCIGFARVDQGVSILGVYLHFWHRRLQQMQAHFADLVLKDKIFVYDLAHQRIGWTDYDCSSSVNVSITSGKDEFVNSGQLTVSGSSIPVLFEHPTADNSAIFLKILAVAVVFFL